MDAMRACAVGGLMALTACSIGSDGQGGGFRESIGLDAPPPDEFLVVSRKPLERPADFVTLPPPQPGARSRVEPDPTGEARAALLGGPAGDPPPANRDAAFAAAAPPGASASETALIAATGAATLEPVDRTAIAAEAEPQERRYGLDSFLGYEIDQGDGGERLDSRDEAERLRAEGVQAPTPPPAEDE